MVSLSFALFAFSLIVAFGISLPHGALSLGYAMGKHKIDGSIVREVINDLDVILRQPTGGSRVPIPTQTAQQTQNSVAGVKPLRSGSWKPEKKPAVAVPDDKLFAVPMPLLQRESIQEMLVANSNIPEIPPMIPEETAVVRVGSDVKEPALTARIAAAYPADARQSGVEGEVIIDAIVDATGKPTTLKVVSGPVLLRPAAIESVRKWQYRPGYRADDSGPIEMRIAVQFRLVS